MAKEGWFHEMRISRVIPRFENRSISSGYQVFRMRRSNGRFGYADEVFAKLAADAHVASVAFYRGSEAWVMVRRQRPGASDGGTMRRAMSGRSDLAFAEERIDAVGDRMLLQLCLSAVAGCTDMRGASNVCGRLFVVSLGKPNTVYFKGTTCPSAIHALEIGISPRMELELRVRTFTSCAARHFKNTSPRFELVDGRYLRRCLSYDDPNDKSLYCMGARWEGDRYGGFAFMDASDADSFSKSKLGILRSVLACLDELFGGAVRIEFEEAEDRSRIDCVSSKLVDRLSLVADHIRGNRVCVCDMSGDLGIEAGIVTDRVSDLFDVNVTITDTPESGAMNLLLIHGKEDYSDASDDPYPNVQREAIAQHMTPASGFTRTAVAVAVKELAIKRDVCAGRMSLFEWQLGDWQFAIRIDNNGGQEFAFLDVDADGSLGFEGPSTAIGASASHAELAEALLLVENCEYALRGPKGDINVIGRTELFGVPNFEAVWQDLIKRKEERNEGLNGRPLKHAIGRGKADRELYFADAVDVASCATSDGTCYYRVGLRGYGMQYSATHKASILREVMPIGCSKTLADDLLPMLDVSMVRWGQPTVVPFPLKYLREWLAMRVI